MHGCVPGFKWLAIRGHRVTSRQAQQRVTDEHLKQEIEALKGVKLVSL